MGNSSRKSSSDHLCIISLETSILWNSSRNNVCEYTRSVQKLVVLNVGRYKGNINCVYSDYSHGYV